MSHPALLFSFFDKKEPQKSKYYSNPAIFLKTKHTFTYFRMIKMYQYSVKL